MATLRWTTTVCLLVTGLAAALHPLSPVRAAGPEATAVHAWQSGPERVVLVELFTSEGCSSCPPAERWLNGLADRDGIWNDFIPIAWHVDYWDGLGWRDPFAAPGHSARQRSYARSGSLSQVYTPGVLRGGQEWRAWPGPPAGNGQVSVGQLELQVDREATVRFTPVRQGHFVAHVVRLGSGLVSEVAAGENAGRELKHDFVVLGSGAAAMEPNADGGFTATLPLPEARTPAPATAWVAWVEETDSPVPVQATGGVVP